MEEIFFNKVKAIYGWLGNMSPYPITYQELVFGSAEALFQALRFEGANNEGDIVLEIISAKSAFASKLVSKSYSFLMKVRPTSDTDVANMEKVLRLKLEQNPELVKMLLDTGEAEIYEDVSKRHGERDDFWGARRQEDGSWEGKNVLGNIWMKLREELRNVG